MAKIIKFIIRQFNERSMPVKPGSNLIEKNRRAGENKLIKTRLIYIIQS
jgi:hypothetical protein